MEVDIIKRNESKLEVWFVSESLQAVQTRAIGGIKILQNYKNSVFL
jgi:hypothetical protein